MADSDNIDPMKLMREWFIKSEKMWSDALTDMMGDERFSRSAGRYMQEALHTQRMFSESMGQYLANMNLPSRTDVMDIKDRLSHMEDSLNHVLIELRALKAAQARPAGESAARKKPARTRKAPKKN